VTSQDSDRKGKPEHELTKVVYYNSGCTHVNVRRYITLDTRIGVNQPSSSKFIVSLKDRVLYVVLHLWKPMLELMSHKQTGKARTDGDDTKFPWSVCIFVVQGEFMFVYLVFRNTICIIAVRLVLSTIYNAINLCR